MGKRPLFNAALLLLVAAGPVLSAEETVARSSTGPDLNNQAVAAAQAGDFEQAARLLRQATALSPEDAQIRQNRAAILADWGQRLLEQEGRPDRAREALRESLEVDSEQRKALFLLADLEYNSGGELSRPLAMWKKAYAQGSAVERTVLQQRIEQAERDLRIERGFSAARTAHFQVHYELEAHEEAARQVGELLEKHYALLSGVLGSSPQQLTAILYSERDFRRVAGKDWVLGLYDGRIRLRVEDVEAGRAEPLLAHELAHAFLMHAYGPLLPVWIHEGFAQAMEPERSLSEEEGRMERQIEARSAWVPLRWLDRRFQQPSNNEDVGKAYLQARFTVRKLLRLAGPEKFRDFLRQIGSGVSVDRAYNQSFSPSVWVRADQGNFD